MFRILIICTANVCRSPVAMTFLRNFLSNHSVEVDSAGVFATIGSRVDPVMLHLMSESGYPEIESHHSRLFLPSFLARYEIILCMEKMHILELQKIAPSATGRVMLLGHWSNGSEVDDPTGRNAEEYRRCVSIIELFCRQWVERILSMGLLE